MRATVTAALGAVLALYTMGCNLIVGLTDHELGGAGGTAGSTGGTSPTGGTGQTGGTAGSTGGVGGCGTFPVDTEVEIVADGEESPSFLSVDGSSLYWVNSASSSGTIRHIDLACPASVDTVVELGGIAIQSFTTYQGQAFWTQNTAAGGANDHGLDGLSFKNPSKVVSYWTSSSGEVLPVLAASGGHLYFRPSENFIAIMEKLPNAQASAVDMHNPVVAVLLGDSRAYWAVNGVGVVSTSLSDPNDYTTEVSATQFEAFAQDAENLYWIESGSPKKLYRAPKSDFTKVTPLLTSPPPTTSIVSDGTYLYLASPENSTIQRVEISTGALSMFKTAVPGPPGRLLLADGYLYGTSTTGGKVIRVPIVP